MGKQVNSLIKSICEDLGYVKNGLIYVKKTSTDISSSISFNLTAYQTKGHVLVGPRIGVYCGEVEKILIIVAQSEYIKGYAHTISEHIGYLMPESTWKEWDFVEHGITQKSVINDFREAILKYTTIYYENFSSIDKIIAIIESTKWGSANYNLLLRLPILYYMANRKQDGIDYINETLTKHSDASILFSDVYISNYLKLPDTLQ